MAIQDFHRGAEMALRSFGVVDTAKRTELMNQLHQAQMAKTQQDVQSERAMAQAGQEWAQGGQAPDFGQYGGMSSEFGPPESFARTPTEQDFPQLAAKIAGIPGGMPQAINLMKIGVVQRDTPQDKLNRVITSVMLRQQTQNPNMSIQQDTDDNGNVTITGIDKGSGQQIWQKNLGPIGKTLPPSYSYLQTSEGFVPAVTRGPGAGTVKEPTGIGRPIPAGAVEKIGGLEGLLNDIGQVKSLYGYGTNQQQTGWIGPIAGRVGTIREKYTGGALPEQVKFYSYVRDMKDALLRARSGAQINEQEYSRLINFLPDENLPHESFVPRLERFEAEVNNVLATKKQALTEGGYGSLGNKAKNNDPLGIR